LAADGENSFSLALYFRNNDNFDIKTDFHLPVSLFNSIMTLPLSEAAPSNNIFIG
jgi:hypothetical protein